MRKQNFQENIRNLYKPLTDTIKYNSQDITKTLTETSVENTEAIEIINNKIFEIMNDRGIIASYLLSASSKTINLESTTHFNFVEISNSIRVNDLLIHNTVSYTFYEKLLAFRDTVKVFELKGYRLRMITKIKLIIDLASLSVKKNYAWFAKEMYFNVEATGNNSTRDRTIIKLPKSAIMASGTSTIFFFKKSYWTLC